MQPKVAAGPRSGRLVIVVLGTLFAVLTAGEAVAQDVGRVKTVKGTVYMERGGGAS